MYVYNVGAQIYIKAIIFVTKLHHMQMIRATWSSPNLDMKSPMAVDLCKHVFPLSSIIIYIPCMESPESSEWKNEWRIGGNRWGSFYFHNSINNHTHKNMKIWISRSLLVLMWHSIISELKHSYFTIED